MNQCWNIVNLALRNKLQLNVNHNSYIFIQENACENVILEKTAICLRLNVLDIHTLGVGGIHSSKGLVLVSLYSYIFESEFQQHI